jgi:hypothetical protein
MPRRRQPRRAQREMTTATATISNARPAEGRTASVGVSAAAHRFERAVAAVILANSAVMLWSLIDHSREELLENVDLAFLWFFGKRVGVDGHRAASRRARAGHRPTAHRSFHPRPNPAHSQAVSPMPLAGFSRKTGMRRPPVVSR